MLTFQVSDPFPLVSHEKHSYMELKNHSAAVDKWLDLRVREVERRLHESGCRKRAPDASGGHQQLWFGLEEQSLLTPYIEIRQLLSALNLKPGQKVVDLGAAYGRMGFVMNRHYPDVDFVGYEYVGERVEEGRRCLRARNCSRARLEHADLTSPRFRLDAADVFFIYDYGTPHAIEKTLYDLKRLASEANFLLVGRGRHCRYAIDSRHPWLEKLNPLDGEKRVTIYKSNLRSERGVDLIETSM